MAAAAKKTDLNVLETTPPPASRRTAAAKAAPAAKTALSVVGPRKPAFSLPVAVEAALETARANTFLCDRDMTILYVNQQAMDTLMLMEPNLHAWGDAWRDFHATDVVGRSLDFLFTDEPLEYRRATDPRNHPYCKNIKTGPCTCDVQVTSVRDRNGEVIGYAVDWDRITDKLAQEARVHQLKVTLEQSTANTFLCDLDWNVLYANKKAQDIMAFMEPNLHAWSDAWKSFHASDAVGKSLSWLFTDEPEHLKKASDPRSHPYQCIIRTGPCTCDVTVTSTTDEKGAVTGYAVYWERITERVAQEKKITQIQSALDGANTNVMIVDTDLKMIYMNQSSSRTLKGIEPDLKKVYGPSFQVDDLMGRCIDDLHKNPMHQRTMLKNEAIFPHKANIQIGPLTLALTVNAVKDKDGKTIAFSAEWADISERLREEARQQEEIEEKRYLSAKVKEMMTAAVAITQGDLTRQIPVEKDDAIGQLGNAFNDMVANLSQLVAQVRVGSDSIADASAEVAAGNDDLSRRTEEQAANLEETASSMEEMTSTVKQNADNARQANQLAAQAREVAEKGGSVVGSAVTSMGEINTASKRIADIISVIDEIAFQTNLLALNAAVEAARVGEQGRGFAVVAAEVRNLAGRSATAAKEIKSLVQDSVQKVQEGSSLVNQSGQQLGEIVSAVKKVADIMAEISAAGQEQAAGIEQVNKAILQMDQITQQNAALVEEATATSQAMSQQARDLQGVVGQFQVQDHYLDAVRQSVAAPTPAKRPAPVTRPAPSARPTFTRPAARTAAPALRRPAASVADSDGFEEF